MAGEANREPERLEDQLRRMIISSGPAQSTPSESGQQPPPNVRLPPAATSPQVRQNAPRMNPDGRAARWRNTKSNVPQDPSDVPPQQIPEHRYPQSPGRRGGNQATQAPAPHDFQQRQLAFNQQSPRFAPGGPAQNNQRARYQQQMQLDPNAFQRGNFRNQDPRQQAGPHQQLFNPNAPPRLIQHHPGDQHMRQAHYLEQMAAIKIGQVEMSADERDGKECFRLALDKICQEVCETDPARLPQVSLECFGSFKSGFATAGSDMDLVIVVKNNSATSACFSLIEDDLPRVLEKQLLKLGYGARLLTRTRVPIIKVCEKPDPEFLSKLKEEREKWDLLPEEEKYPHLHQVEEVVATEGAEHSAAETVTKQGVERNHAALAQIAGPQAQQGTSTDILPDVPALTNGRAQRASQAAPEKSNEVQNEPKPPQRREEPKAWTRERKAGPLDFPKTGVGVQSDINFFNPLGLHNTQLLRCYSICDPRVRPMILFVKAWAKRRKINSSYSGTLSSYGYVLMVLHYLVNVVQPPVLPNLQSSWRPPGATPAHASSAFVVEDWPIFFWNNEEEILAAAQKGLLTPNREPLGSLLAGFLHYYSSQGGGPQFRWTQEVLSLRSMRGILSKQEKGWVKADKETREGKTIQHRYLFCIEDPFELSHNVARTVTHHGIVAIRDEFRRAKRILQAAGNGHPSRDGELFAQMVEAEDFQQATEELKKTSSPSNTTRSNVSSAISEMQSNGASQHQPRSGKAPPNRQSPVPRNLPMRGAGNVKRDAAAGGTMSKKNNAFDVTDNDAFPTLGGAKSPRKKKHTSPTNGGNGDWSEISGDQARLVLEDVKRKKDEAHAEQTALGAAEAVLGDSD